MPKGQIPWNKGKIGVYSAEIIQKFRDRHADVRGSKNPNYGKHLSEATKEKIRERARNRVHPCWVRKVELKCLTCGRIFKRWPSQLKEKGYGKFCSHSCVAIWRVKHQKTKNTKIELKVEHYLKKLGLNYQSQKIIKEGRTVADFYIPEQRLVIYADGVYWHSRKETQKRDATQDLLLGINGYKVIRLPEEDIKKGSFRRKLKRAFEGRRPILRVDKGKKEGGK